MIARQACWEILRDRVLSIAPNAVIRKRIVDVVMSDETDANVVKFEDGTCEEANLVIGADGLRSVLRRAMFRQNEKADEPTPAKNGGKGWLSNALSHLPVTQNKSNAAKTDFRSPHYEGLVGVGGFIPSSILESTGHKPGTMSIVFGPNGFFGYGYLTSAPRDTSSSSQNTNPASQHNSNSSLPLSKPGPLAGWWSTFSSQTPYPYSTTSPPTSKGFDKTLALSALQARHAMWSNPSIHAILYFVKADTELHGPNGKGLDASYPTWTTPELPSWSANGRAVLVGDAAHALRPSSGQGACQALEDAEALALFLKHYLASCPDSSSFSLRPHLTQALASYHAFRSPRVHKIHSRSQKMSNLKSDMNVVTEYVMYFIIWMMTWRWLNNLLMRLGLNDLEKYNEELFGYDLPRELEKFLAEEKGGNVGR